MNLSDIREYPRDKSNSFSWGHNEINSRAGSDLQVCQFIEGGILFLQLMLNVWGRLPPWDLQVSCIHELKYVYPLFKLLFMPGWDWALAFLRVISFKCYMLSCFFFLNNLLPSEQGLNVCLGQIVMWAMKIFLCFHEAIWKQAWCFFIKVLTNYI